MTTLPQPIIDILQRAHLRRRRTIRRRLMAVAIALTVTAALITAIKTT